MPGPREHKGKSPAGVIIPLSIAQRWPVLITPRQQIPGLVTWQTRRVMISCGCA
jgi:hypothetical protein